MFYVYAHFKPNSIEPFYIGKGSKKRAFSYSERNTHWHNIVNKYNYRVEILHQNLDEQTAFDLETNYIQCFGRRDLGTGCLVNMTDGGDGNSGLVFSKLHRTRLSLASTGKYVTIKTRLKLSKASKGRLHSLETRQKISAANKGRPSEKKNIPLSIETRQKISSAKLGHTVSKETRQKISAANKGRPSKLRGTHLSQKEKQRRALSRKPRQLETRRRNIKKRTCIVCGMVGKGPNMSRYHFFNCKGSK